MELCKRLPLGEDVDVNLFTVAVLAMPHFMRACIYFMPHIWKKMFGPAALSVITFLFFVFKWTSIAAMLTWLWASRDDGICFDASQITFNQFTAAVVLLAIGQSLIFGAHQTAGSAGMFFGKRLGMEVQEVRDWPYSAVKHPHYVGDVLCAWSGCVLLRSQSPPGLLHLTVYCTLMYALNALWEDWL